MQAPTASAQGKNKAETRKRRKRNKASAGHSENCTVTSSEDSKRQYAVDHDLLRPNRGKWFFQKNEKRRAEGGSAAKANLAPVGISLLGGGEKGGEVGQNQEVPRARMYCPKERGLQKAKKKWYWMWGQERRT